MKQMRASITILMLVAVLVGCGLPKEVRKQAEGMTPKLEEANQEVTTRWEQYNKLEKTEEYQNFLGMYAQREQWSASFTQAQAKLAEARQLIDSKLKQLLEDNKAKDAENVNLLIKQIAALRSEAMELSKKPNERIGFLRDVREKAPGIVQAAQQQAAKSREVMTGLQQVAEQQKAKYPNRSNDIIARVAPTQALLTEAEQSLKTVEQQFAAVNQGQCDYAVLGDSAKVVERNNSTIAGDGSRLRGILTQLDRSYSKTLVDMRVDYFVQVGRTSWDDYSDFNTDEDYMYPSAAVTPEAYEYFVTLGEGVLATQGFGWDSDSDVTPKIDGQHWSMLKVAPKQSWPSGHDEAEYWLADDSAKYYHKYLIVEDGKERQGDWQEVSEEVFETHEDDLGMDIMAKPVGVFEDEVLKQTMPAGMAFVGNSNYGEWQKDPDTGDSFWAWYGRWHFYSTLFGGPGRGYYQNEWNTWDRDYRSAGKPFYGVDGERYGTEADGTRKRFATAHAFGDRGVVGRGVSGSVRNAGSVRGGGPGGRGK